jgi:hypothetical protein
MPKLGLILPPVSSMFSKFKMAPLFTLSDHNKLSIKFFNTSTISCFYHVTIINIKNNNAKVRFTAKVINPAAILCLHVIVWRRGGRGWLGLKK